MYCNNVKKTNALVWSLWCCLQICLKTKNWTKIIQENKKTNLHTEVLLPIGFASQNFTACLALREILHGTHSNSLVVLKSQNLIMGGTKYTELLFAMSSL